MEDNKKSQEETIYLLSSLIKAIEKKIEVQKERREILLKKDDSAFKPSRPNSQFEEDADYIMNIKDTSIAALEYSIEMLKLEKTGREIELEQMKVQFNEMFKPEEKDGE